ncbi:uncharacterized protein [Apostichopus japonicus]|uniref:uncharacterized protein n=1 Tax=Stichopus japonicus TaxID=307972 RepID=UPI003AB5EAF6
MKFFATFAVFCYVAIYSVNSDTTSAVNPNYDPIINETFTIDDDFGTYRWGLRSPIDIDDQCFYVWFEVVSSNTVYIQFAATEEDGTDASYNIMIGNANNKYTCIQRGNGEWLLDINTPGIMTDEVQRFYIQLEHGVWTIGFHEGDVIGSVNDPNIQPIIYVGISSAAKSSWVFFWPGFGRRTIAQEVEEEQIGEYIWRYPNFLEDEIYVEFGVKAEQDARIVFSAENEYLDDIYEVMLGATYNILTCIRRKKGEEALVDLVTIDIVDPNEFRYFWVHYYINDDGQGIFSLGRYGEPEPYGVFKDDDPINVRYVGLTSFECVSSWLLWLPCARPSYVCETEIFDMRCDEGLIVIDSALYGRENLAYCPYEGPTAEATTCGDPAASLEAVKQQCRYQQACSIEATNEIFGEPCAGVPKYLQIEYRCCTCDD